MTRDMQSSMARRVARPPYNSVTGLTLLTLIALAIGVIVAYRIGARHGRREDVRPAPGTPLQTPPSPSAPSTIAPTAAEAPLHSTVRDEASRERLDHERARLIVSDETQSARLGGELDTAQAELAWLRTLAHDRRALHRALAEARGQTARYRQIVVDIENNAPPPLLDSPHAPDDLKLIVGVGPVLERMLQQLGIGTYRQIARWSERDIDDFDARLPEFRGRIRRDGWVVQARALHQSKYGDNPRERS